jgi:hypothetical protein
MCNLRGLLNYLRERVTLTDEFGRPTTNFKGTTKEGGGYIYIGVYTHTIKTINWNPEKSNIR